MASVTSLPHRQSRCGRFFYVPSSVYLDRQITQTGIQLTYL